jgi:hypothetical protein
MKRIIATVILTLSLVSAALPAQADVWYDINGYQSQNLKRESAAAGTVVLGPPCYGHVYSYHAWNLYAPTTIYAVDSCTTARVLAQRGAVGAGMALGLIPIARYPQVAPPATALVALYNIQTAALVQCAVAGRGVILGVDNRNGMVISCSSQ